MNYVEQLKLVVEASSKVIWAVFAASIIVLAVEKFWPDQFVGLPVWAMPMIRLAAIFFGVLALFSFLKFLAQSAKLATSSFIKSIRRPLIKERLLLLDIGELIPLCLALGDSDRSIWLKPDIQSVISLKEKGLLIRLPVIVVAGDGKDCFQVPLDVWKLLQSMQEFRVNNRDGLKAALALGKIDEILKFLPHSHPAVQEESKRLGLATNS